MPGAKGITNRSLIHAQFAAGPNAALLTEPDCCLFIAPCKCELVRVEERHGTLGTDGSAVTLDITKAADGTAPGSGTSMLASTFNLKATINTKQTKTKSNGGLSTTAGALILDEGDTANCDFGGTMTAVTGVRVDAWFRPITTINY